MGWRLFSLLDYLLHKVCESPPARPVRIPPARPVRVPPARLGLFPRPPPRPASISPYSLLASYYFPIREPVGSAQGVAQGSPTPSLIGI